MINNSTNNKKKSFLSQYLKARSSIYGQVVYVILIMSILLFLAFGVIFRSVNEKYMKNVIQQCGTRVAFLVEGSLYYSMLENDVTTLQNTLKVIHTLPGISDVNMYNSNNDLVYTSSSISLSADSIKRYKSNCKACHSDMKLMFAEKEKSYRIINTDSDCEMNQDDNSHRHLFIKSPILNQNTCSTNECHVHNKTDEVLGSLIIKVPLESLDNALYESSTDFFLMATIMTILLLTFLILFTSKKIRKPLSDIINASKAVASGDTSTRLIDKPHQLEDMKMVRHAFNHMLDSLNSATNELQNWSHQLEYKVQKKSEELVEAQNELIHIERIASLGKLSSSVAHEINNPLSGVLTYTKLVQKQLGKQQFDNAKKESILSHLKMIETETKRCGDIVKGLLDFSRKDQDNFEPKHLHKILLETSKLMTHQMKIENISFVSDLNAKEDMIFCSQNQIKQACVAILVNASEAVFEHGEVLFKTSNPDDDHIKIEIIDNGTGIAEDDLPHIFEPFYSKKQKASGIGLGLSIVHGIVQNHKGKIEVKSEPGKYTNMSIILPLHNN